MESGFDRDSSNACNIGKHFPRCAERVFRKARSPPGIGCQSRLRPRRLGSIESLEGGRKDFPEGGVVYFACGGRGQRRGTSWAQQRLLPETQLSPVPTRIAGTEPGWTAHVTRC